MKTEQTIREATAKALGWTFVRVKKRCWWVCPGKQVHLSFQPELVEPSPANRPFSVWEDKESLRGGLEKLGLLPNPKDGNVILAVRDKALMREGDRYCDCLAILYGVRCGGNYQQGYKATPAEMLAASLWSLGLIDEETARGYAQKEAPPSK